MAALAHSGRKWGAAFLQTSRDINLTLWLLRKLKEMHHHSYFVRDDVYFSVFCLRSILFYCVDCRVEVRERILFPGVLSADI